MTCHKVSHFTHLTLC